MKRMQGRRPMLSPLGRSRASAKPKKFISVSNITETEKDPNTYDGGALKHRRVVEIVDYVELEVVSLSRSDS